jgi:hypothetical protein
LQTEQDKNRLLDGLESAAGDISRMDFDKLISSLGKRVFVLHSIHAKQPELLETRWTMNFLAGPLTRNRIPDLNKLANAEAVRETSSPIGAQPVGASVMAAAPTLRPTAARSAQSQPPAAQIESSSTKPPIPASIREYFLPNNYTLPEAFSAAQRQMPAEAMINSMIYHPTLLASAEVRVLDQKHGVDSLITRTALVTSPEKRGSVRWEDYPLSPSVLDSIDTSPTPSTRFSSIDAPLNDVKLMTALQKDFTDWVFRNSSVKARVNQALKVFAGPDVSQAEFMKACAEAAREARDAESAKKAATLDRQLKTLKDRLAREERELQMDQTELEHRKWEERGNLAELGASLVGIGRRKSLTSQLSKNRLTNKAKAEVEESIDAIAQYKQQIADLERQREETVAEINDRWGGVVNEITEVTVAPRKTDIFVKLFGVAWMPYYVVKSDTDTFELPAFGAE